MGLNNVKTIGVQAAIPQKVGRMGVRQAKTTDVFICLLFGILVSTCEDYGVKIATSYCCINWKQE